MSKKPTKKGTATKKKPAPKKTTTKKPAAKKKTDTKPKTTKSKKPVTKDVGGAIAKHMEKRFLNIRDERRLPPKFLT